MSALITWLRSHAAAILATMIAVAKAGVVGKTASTIILAVAAAVSN